MTPSTRRQERYGCPSGLRHQCLARRLHFIENRCSDQLKQAAFDVYLVSVNGLLRWPGHTFRIFVLYRLCRWDIGTGTSVERGLRVTTKGGVRLGSGCNINRDVTLDGRGGLAIGDQVNISPEVAVLTAEHDPDSPCFKGRTRSVTIGSRSWLATRATILPGAVLGEGAVVGAGAIISGIVPPWSIVGHGPAREIRSRDPGAQAMLESYRRWLH